MQRSVTCSLSVILVGDRCAEERHDAVAGELVDGALEPMDALGEAREEAIHDLVPVFGIDCGGQLHRPLHVGKSLEEENRRLKQIVADLTLDNQALKTVASKKW